MQKTWDETLFLISQGVEQDEIGNPVSIQERTEIYTCQLPISRNEFYLAGRNGIQPEAVFEIHSFEYSGEMLVEFQNQLYSVIRVYQRSKETIELICRTKAGDFNG